MNKEKEFLASIPAVGWISVTHPNYTENLFPIDPGGSGGCAITLDAHNNSFKCELQTEFTDANNPLTLGSYLAINLRDIHFDVNKIGGKGLTIVDLNVKDSTNESTVYISVNFLVKRLRIGFFGKETVGGVVWFDDIDEECDETETCMSFHGSFKEFRED